MEKLITAIKSLLDDITSMQSGTDDNWFGTFSESQEDRDGNVEIEWPNLAISADELRKALIEYEKENT